MSSWLDSLPKTARAIYDEAEEIFSDLVGDDEEDSDDTKPSPLLGEGEEPAPGYLSVEKAPSVSVESAAKYRAGQFIKDEAKKIPASVSPETRSSRQKAIVEEAQERLETEYDVSGDPVGGIGSYELPGTDTKLRDLPVIGGIFGQKVYTPEQEAELREYREALSRGESPEEPVIDGEYEGIISQAIRYLTPIEAAVAATVEAGGDLAAQYATMVVEAAASAGKDYVAPVLPTDIDDRLLSGIETAARVYREERAIRNGYDRDTLNPLVFAKEALERSDENFKNLKGLPDVSTGATDDIRTAAIAGFKESTAGMGLEELPGYDEMTTGVDTAYYLATWAPWTVYAGLSLVVPGVPIAKPLSKAAGATTKGLARGADWLSQQAPEALHAMRGKLDQVSRFLDPTDRRWGKLLDVVEEAHATQPDTIGKKLASGRVDDLTKAERASLEGTRFAGLADDELLAKAAKIANNTGDSAASKINPFFGDDAAKAIDYEVEVEKMTRDLTTGKTAIPKGMHAITDRFAVAGKAKEDLLKSVDGAAPKIIKLLSNASELYDIATSTGKITGKDVEGVFGDVLPEMTGGQVEAIAKNLDVAVKAVTGAKRQDRLATARKLFLDTVVDSQLAAMYGRDELFDLYSDLAKLRQARRAGSVGLGASRGIRRAERIAESGEGMAQRLRGAVEQAKKSPTGLNPILKGTRLYEGLAATEPERLNLYISRSMKRYVDDSGTNFIGAIKGELADMALKQAEDLLGGFEMLKPYLSAKTYGKAIEEITSETRNELSNIPNVIESRFESFMNEAGGDASVAWSRLLDESSDRMELARDILYKLADVEDQSIEVLVAAGRIGRLPPDVAVAKAKAIKTALATLEGLDVKLGADVDDVREALMTADMPGLAKLVVDFVSSEENTAVSAHKFIMSVAAAGNDILFKNAEDLPTEFFYLPRSGRALASRKTRGAEGIGRVLVEVVGQKERIAILSRHSMRMAARMPDLVPELPLQETAKKFSKKKLQKAIMRFGRSLGYSDRDIKKVLMHEPSMELLTNPSDTQVRYFEMLRTRGFGRITMTPREIATNLLAGSDTKLLSPGAADLVGETIRHTRMLEMNSLSKNPTVVAISRAAAEGMQAERMKQLSELSEDLAPTLRELDPRSVTKLLREMPSSDFMPSIEELARMEGRQIRRLLGSTTLLTKPVHRAYARQMVEDVDVFKSDLETLQRAWEDIGTDTEGNLVAVAAIQAVSDMFNGFGALVKLGILPGVFIGRAKYAMDNLVSAAWIAHSERGTKAALNTALHTIGLAGKMALRRPARGVVQAAGRTAGTVAELAVGRKDETTRAIRKGTGDLNKALGAMSTRTSRIADAMMAGGDRSVIVEAGGLRMTAGEWADLFRSMGVDTNQLTVEVGARQLNSMVARNLVEAGWVNEKFVGPMMNTGSNMLNFAADTANQMDTTFRIAEAIRVLDETGDIGKAIQAGRDILFDYGNMNIVEKMFISKLVYIYSFPRSVVASTLRMLKEQPGMVRMQYRASGGYASEKEGQYPGASSYMQSQVLVPESMQNYMLDDPDMYDARFGFLTAISGLEIMADLVHTVGSMGGALLEGDAFDALDDAAKSVVLRGNPIANAVFSLLHSGEKEISFGDIRDTSNRIDPGFITLAHSLYLWPVFKHVLNLEAIEARDDQNAIDGIVWQIPYDDTKSKKLWLAMRTMLVFGGVESTLREQANLLPTSREVRKNGNTSWIRRTADNLRVWRIERAPTQQEIETRQKYGARETFKQ